LNNDFLADLIILLKHPKRALLGKAGSKLQSLLEQGKDSRELQETRNCKSGEDGVETRGGRGKV
jgi:hypothetical protein